MKDHRFLKALRLEPVDSTPIWIMRQAGRHLPEYREIRKKVPDFMALCRNPELTLEVALQPLRRYDLDAAIVFSDILTIPDAMGLGLRFEPGIGPVFERPLATERDILNLDIPDMAQDLGYVMESVRVLSNELRDRLPVIGFSGSPWTLATYMVEGGSSKQFSKVKGLMYRSPELMHTLLDVLARTVTEYLRAQVEAGADALMIFDSWGGVLSTPCYEMFSLSYMQRIVADLKNINVPVILFTKGGGLWLEKIIETGCQCVGLDWTVDISEARKRAAGRVALQGNMDPQLLLAAPDRIQQEARALLESHGDYPGYIFNLGHGIIPDAPPEHVAALVEAVRAGVSS